MPEIRPHRSGSVAARSLPLALCLAASLALASCTSSTDPGAGGDRQQPVQPAATSATTPAGTPLTVGALEPITLLPADVRDPDGRRIVRELYRGLMRFDAKGKAVPELAKSIETADNQTFTVHLTPGWTFADGTAVTAASFVDAWNYAARPSNNQRARASFAPILGYDQVAPSRGKPTATTLRGLDVIDATTFSITLARPDVRFTARLAEPAFAPLPAATLKDPAAAATRPVGNGPYRIASAWKPGSGLTLVPFAGYLGEDKPRNAGLKFQFVSNPVRAYAQLKAGGFDLYSVTDPASLATFKSDLKLRAVIQPVGASRSLAFPMTIAPWNTSAGPKLRAAISMAIDRPALTSQVLHGAAIPATDLAAPLVDGSSQDLCGSLCSLDVDAAKQQLQDAGGWPAGKTLTIAYNGATSDGAWVAPLCKSVTETLGIPCVGTSYPTQAAYLRAVTDRRLTTAWVDTTWMANPDLGSFLTPRYRSNAPENDTRYAASKTDSLLAKAEGLAAAGDDTATAAYQDAERQVLADLPTIPLWTVDVNSGSSERVQDVKIDVFGDPIYTEISLKQ